MGIRSAFSPMAAAKSPYKKGEVLFDGKDGDTAVLEFPKGYYYVRGQGSGGPGGNNNYWANGGGGGSGAGFEGYVYISEKIDEVKVYAGKASTSTGVSGEDTYIENLLMLGAGQPGGSGPGGKGGVLTFVNEALLSIAKAIIAKNGYDGLSVGSNSAPGGNSVLTEDGGGPAGAGGQVGKTATKPGAGGAGGTQWDGAGGLGKYGELLIRYEGSRLPTTN